MGNTGRQQRASEAVCRGLPGSGRGQWATGQTQRTGQFTGTPVEGALSSILAFLCSYVGYHFINIMMSPSRSCDLHLLIYCIIITSYLSTFINIFFYTIFKIFNHLFYFYYVFVNFNVSQHDHVTNMYLFLLYMFVNFYISYYDHLTYIYLFIFIMQSILYIC